MWRNVFGHGIYQIIVLIVLIFLGPGRLVPVYWTACDEFGPAPKAGAKGEDAKRTCLKYNPFYNEELYDNPKSLDFWEKKGELGDEAFDASALKAFRYWKWKDRAEEAGEREKIPTLEEVEKDAALSKEVLKGYPKDLNKAGDKTQKLRHYTFIFQAFVFMQLFNQLNARKLGGELNVLEGITANPLFIAVVVFTFVIQMVIVEVGGRITKTYPLDMRQNVFCIAVGSGELLWGVIIKQLPVGLFQCVTLDESPVEQDAPATASSALKKSKTLRQAQ